MLKYGDMAEMNTYDRIIFKKGKQAEFIFACKSHLNLTWTALAKLAKVNCRTLRDWSKEKNKMSYNSALILSKESLISLPVEIGIMKWSDHLRNISVMGGRAHHNKYGKIGDDAYRMSAWLSWWNGEGKYTKLSIFERKKITEPKRNVDLAEFVGIVIGDGSISEYVVKITLDTAADKEYVPYVSSLIKKLFDVTSTIYNHKNSRATDILIQRKNVVDFCRSIGLMVGNKIKNNIDIPNWIKINKKLSLACVRGLVDTDGCFYDHSYRVNGKKYIYTKIAFTNRCPLVLQSVRVILINSDICVRITKDGNDVRIEGQKDVEKYRILVGTSNPKFQVK